MTPEPVAREYALARRALLDVLELLAAQRGGLILVGAQAVYLHAPAEQANRVTYTTDGDLAIDPDLLSAVPDIGSVLMDSGYQRGENPGTFRTPSGIQIDLMVPEGVAAGSGRRTAELEGQSRFTARRTAGIEVALLDAAPHRIAALEDGDDRAIELRVAGPAALTVAKLVKLEERVTGTRRDRIVSKDADDLLRLLRYCDAAAIGRRLAALDSEHAVPVIQRSISFLRADLARKGSHLVALAVEARADTETPQQIGNAFRELGRRALDAFDGGADR